MTMRLTLLATIFSVSACVAPRDTVSALDCANNAQCPADGKHYCNISTGQCQPCDGACPGANVEASSASPNSNNTSARADATAASAEVNGTGAEDVSNTQTDAGNDSTATTSGQSCVERCGDYDVDAACNCDDKCDEFDDCCPDYQLTCGGSATPSDAGSVSDGS